MANIINQFGQIKVGFRSAQVVNSIDTDAQAFITAANITDSTQQSAINTLVTQLKTYGIWTKMKAIYPFVGGTASSHKFNLKDPRDLDAAFRLVFGGGWTHSSTGALPNGTNGYVNTYLHTNNVLTPNNLSIGLYTNTNRAADTSPSRIAYGNSDNTTTYVPLTQLYLRSSANTLISDLGNGNFGRVNVTNTTTAGFYVNTRTANNSMKVFKNNTLIGSSTITNPTNTLPNSYLYFAAFNGAGSYVGSYESINYQFSYVSDGLSDTEAANFYTAVQTFQTTLGRQVGVPIVADSDAQAFLNAAVITDTTQASAINTLVTSLKSANIWTKMKAIYPFVGGTANSHKFNLKDPRDVDAAYRLVFNGGWTHSSTGALPNGTNGYADTFFRPFTHLTNVNSAHFSKYNRTNDLVGNKLDGIYEGSSNTAFQFNYSVGYTNLGNFSSGISYTSTDARGFFTASRTSSTSIKAYRNAIQQGSTNTATNTTMPNKHVVLGARSDDNAAQFFYNTYEAAFASIGDGLTDAEATAFYNAVQTFQTTLGRQIVSDSDAQAFIDAASITNTTQKSAINTLVTELKAANIWTKMKAIYPFVGGTASSHKFNLKDPRDVDAAFRLVFNGGWTHSSTGALPNGSNAYADTKMNANSTNFDYQSMSATFYSRTNNSLGVNDIGVQTGANRRFIELNIKEGNLSYMALSHQGISYLNFTNNDSRGFYHSNRIDSNTIKLYKNGTNVASGTQTSTDIYGEYSVYISALNARHNNNQVLYFSNREVSFTTLGSGLTDAEATAFYNAVQTFQTTLGRQV